MRAPDYSRKSGGRGNLEEALVLVTALVEHAHELVDVLGAARLERDVDRRLAEVDARERAVVDDLLDVGAHRRDLAGQLVQSARVIGDAHAEAYEAPVLDQAALDDARQHVHVDVAAADD